MIPIFVLAVGDFGAEALRRLREVVPGTEGSVLASEGLHPARLPLARLYTLITWRPVPRLMRSVDQLFHDWRVPWFPVVQEHPYLRAGPVVLPGAGGCLHCFERRGTQHSTTASLLTTLYDYYDNNPAAGPSGYLPGLAGMAAAMAGELSHAMEFRREQVAGTVRQFHMVTRDLVRGTVIGIHGCPRCGTKRDERTRSYAALTQDYARIFGESARSEVGV